MGKTNHSAAILYKYVSIFLGVLYIYIYYDNLYSILQKFQKQTEFVPVLFRPRNPMFAIHDIRALPQSSPRSGPKIHSTLCLFNVAIENQYL